MIYTIEQLRLIVAPIAEKYRLKHVWIFGSYARGEATENSDIDFLADLRGSMIDCLYYWNNFCDDLSGVLNKKIDLISSNGLLDNITTEITPYFAANVNRDKVMIYERMEQIKINID
ncbi:MAG: nucleotidyltransferase domain-containing protein [Deltaproteobacteria bacterium]|jgi:predicted nucleotidyltransferase|nr:nucleotidyltransferase domain-containing protein [Deltaproteobacteria bacterium]